MKLFSLAIFSVCLLAACSKDKTTTSNNNGNNNPSQPALNDNEKFLVGSWVLYKAIDSNYSYTELKSVADKAKPCDNDDAYIFSDNKKYHKEEGVDSCYDGGPYTEQSWSISDISYLHYKHGPNLYPSDRGGYFTKLDDKQFKVYSSYYISATNQGSRTFYYKRK